MPNQTIASNVARLRADLDLSQAQLADRAGLSRITLGKIERGDVTPRSETLSDLARGLKVNVAELVTPVRPLPGVRFRAKKRVNSREQILAHVASWLDAYKSLERVVNDEKQFALRDLIGNKEHPAALAAKARAALKLDSEAPIRDVCGLLEDNGVKILLIQKNTDSFFGLSVTEDGGGPAVVVNTWDRISVERWIFTAAHELGHLLLHRDAYDRTRDEENPDEEREADRFASHFLMPDEVFSSEWNQTAGLSLLDRVLKVKRMFLVSYKTVLYRLVESDRLPKEAWKAFNTAHKRRFGAALRKVDEPQRLKEGEFRLDWNKAGEPEAVSKYDFVDDRLSRLVRVALVREEISLSRAAEILGLSRTQMRDLAAAWES